MSEGIKIEVQHTGNGWMKGTVLGYSFEIKRYDEPSEFGIDGGRISKLALLSQISYTVYAMYDRGWDILPRPDDARKAVELICQLWN